MSRYYDRDGNPITMHEWTRTYSDANKRVAHSTVNYRGSDVCISTIWLGLNHQLGDGPPLIFESMVFAEGNKDLDGLMVRYATLAAAIAGHDQIHATLRDGRDLDLAAILGEVTR